MKLDKQLINKLFEEARNNPRLRHNFDLRTSAEDSSQRMLNALLPGTEVAVHKHPMSNENIILLVGYDFLLICIVSIVEFCFDFINGRLLSGLPFIMFLLYGINICRSLRRFCGQGDQRGPSCGAGGEDDTWDRRTRCREPP